jgi:parallel beta-helix repeat protein
LRNKLLIFQKSRFIIDEFPKIADATNYIIVVAAILSMSVAIIIANENLDGDTNARADMGMPLGNSTIYVPDDYSTIQVAVDNAAEGDTIIVRDGTYTENVDVDKALTIQSENGPDSVIVEAASPDDHVFEVTADYVNISGFAVIGASGAYPYHPAGIYLDNTDYCNISDNVVTNNYYGIHIIGSSNNCIENNTLSSSGEYGIWLFDNSLCNSIANNCISNNVERGICLYSSSNNSIKYNNVSNNGIFGIELFDSSNTDIEHNNISNNYESGIWLYKSSNNSITNNNIENNNESEEYGYGIWLSYSSNNLIYLNNFINNTCNVDSSNSTNIWNSTEKITYTYNDNTYTTYFGNYWDDYTGTDENGDGIGGIPYSINGDNDNYPLMQPRENYMEIKIKEKEGGIPGFEILFLVAAIAIALLWKRKRD